MNTETGKIRELVENEKATKDEFELRTTSDEIQRLETNYKYHAPTPDTGAKHSVLRTQGKVLAGRVLTHCPVSWERCQALIKIEEAVMWANAAVARNAP